MITKVFAVYDSKAQSYGVPFFMPSIGAAVRAFGDLCNDNQSMVYRHPGDYVLFHLADFDDNSAVFKAVTPIVQLGLGIDFIEKRAVSVTPALDKYIRDSVDQPLSTNAEIANGK